MYNISTEQLIRDTPQVGELNIDRLPQELTKIYARIISIRRAFSEGNRRFPKGFKKDIKLLRSLAANLETLTVLHRGHEHHSSASFVAGTAYYLLSMIFQRSEDKVRIDKFTSQSIPSSVSAIVLFLIGNSPADAAEVANKVQFNDLDKSITDTIFKALCFLAKGEIGEIAQLELPQKQYGYGEENEEAEDYLWELIFRGIQRLASSLLGRANQETSFFTDVINLSIYSNDTNGIPNQSYFAGPGHLAKLLEILGNDLLQRGLINVPTPVGVNSENWGELLQRLAFDRPYLWQNHFDAINTGFLDSGQSAILTFPTGAGKTTLSELKIASSLMNSQSVIYLVPTHALEDQVNKALSKLFDGAVEDLEIDIGGEYTAIFQAAPKISVMTPERCLTRLSVDSNAFNEVGLVVFDEFHLMSGKDNKLERRSLDAMFCLLRLFSELPNADYLLISAMVENGAEIAEWIEKVTDRPCHNFNSNWKPTRQLHGCIIFLEEQIAALRDKLESGRLAGKTASPSVSLKNDLVASAFQIFSLKNMWETTDSEDYFISNLLDKDVLLSAGKTWKLTSNRNEVAAELAAYFVRLNIKTLVFAEHPGITVSTAKKVAEKVGRTTVDRAALLKKNERLLESLSKELGDLKYSHFVGGRDVAVHHGLMLPLERRLNEQFFKERSGPDLVVATATLAQGINLPAEVVIIAGDDRFDDETDTRETVAAHEILNAAGRAGRAGSAAQGVVLIIPGEVVTFDKKTTLGDRWWELKRKVFSKSDQCLDVIDPLNYLLDTLSDDLEELTIDQKNIIFRLKVETQSASSAKSIFNNSFAAFKSRKKQEDDTFEKKVQKLIDIREQLGIELAYPEWVENVSLKMGIEPQLLHDLGLAIEKETVRAFFDFTLKELIEWMFDWIEGSFVRLEGLFSSVGAQAELARALNLNKKTFTTLQIAERFKEIMPILLKYMDGADYFTIEKLIEGHTDDFLLRARHFILKLVPHFSFAFGVLSLSIHEMCLAKGIDINGISAEIKLLATLIREGFDSVDKLTFKIRHRRYSRVQCHELA